MITVTICDPYKLWREGLRQILGREKDIKVIADVADGDELIPAIKDQEPDVIILELDLPGRSGLDVMDQLQAMYPGIGFLVLSEYPAEQVAIRMFRAGARGYLTKDSDPAELIKAIRPVAAGDLYISPTVSEVMYNKITRKDDKEPYELLSDREYEVMLLLGKGWRITEIADLLSLSVKTISTYRARIFEKMKVSSLSELVRYLLENNLLAKSGEKPK